MKDLTLSTIFIKILIYDFTQHIMNFYLEVIRM